MTLPSLTRSGADLPSPAGRIFDADAHVGEPETLWRDYLAPEYQSLVDFDERGRVQIAGRPSGRGPMPPKLFRDDQARLSASIQQGFDPASQLAAMDREGIERAVLYPSRGLVIPFDEGLPAALRLALCAAYNTWLAEFCAAAPGRLLAAAAISLADLDGAIAEAHRAVEKLGAVALFLRPNPVDDRNLGDPAHAPFFAAAEALDVPLAIHEGVRAVVPQTGVDRFTTYLEYHTVCHPMEQMMACLSLMASGTLDRYPNLRVAFLESGAGWLPYWLWRLEEHRERYGAVEAPAWRTDAWSLFRRQCWISLEADEPDPDTLAARLGADRLVWGSDYPHGDGRFPYALKTFLEAPGLSADQKQQILTENPMKLYRMKR